MPDRCLVFDGCFCWQIPSDKVVFNEKPDMKAQEITDAGKAALESGKYDMVRVNFANPDMVGHTGDLDATKQVSLLISLLTTCSCLPADVSTVSCPALPWVHQTTWSILQSCAPSCP
jgi:hypothetical protein